MQQGHDYGAHAAHHPSHLTDFVVDAGADGVTIQTIAPGITVDEVKAGTGCNVNVPSNLRVAVV